MRVHSNLPISASRPLAVQKPNGRDALIGRFEWTRVQIPLVWNLAPIMLRKLLLRLQDRFSWKMLEG